ncbi:MAG TPA: hypothetical protein VNY04_06840 [Chthoniobacterales bacterium]|jgi:hypothetical protein|nr:hypothetical protein [Chthoniobacterales bacterium]HWY92601.1 hypothetical protein [Chthoniobacterales bacterium]
MNYPYPRFFLDVELAKRRLAQVLATGRGVPDDDLSLPSKSWSFRLHRKPLYERGDHRTFFAHYDM